MYESAASALEGDAIPETSYAASPMLNIFGDEAFGK